MTSREGIKQVPVFRQHTCTCMLRHQNKHHSLKHTHTYYRVHIISIEDKSTNAKRTVNNNSTNTNETPQIHHDSVWLSTFVIGLAGGGLISRSSTPYWQTKSKTYCLWSRNSRALNTCIISEFEPLGWSWWRQRGRQRRDPWAPETVYSSRVGIKMQEWENVCTYFCGRGGRCCVLLHN